MRDQQELNQGQNISRLCRCMAILFLMAWLSVVGQAAPGDLDPLFGNGGKVTTTFNFGGARAIALQTDGKIVAAGQDYSYNTDPVAADIAEGARRIRTGNFRARYLTGWWHAALTTRAERLV